MRSLLRLLPWYCRRRMSLITGPLVFGGVTQGDLDLEDWDTGILVTFVVFAISSGIYL